MYKMTPSTTTLILDLKTKTNRKTKPFKNPHSKTQDTQNLIQSKFSYFKFGAKRLIRLPRHE